MSIEIAIINGAFVDNYTHNDIFKVLQIVGVVKEKPEAAWKGHKDHKYGGNCPWMNQNREMPILNNYMRPLSAYLRPDSLLPVVVSPH
jgi:hypothetical protein